MGNLHKMTWRKSPQLWFPFFFLLLLILCNSPASLQSKGSYLPKISVPNPNPSILCDITNTDSFIVGQISQVNWTVNGYEGNSFVLSANKIVQNFGTIEGNTSFVIPQSVSSLEAGWYALSLQIYASGLLVNETYVVVQFIAMDTFWLQWGPWIVSSVAIISVTGINLYLFKRKTKKIRQIPEGLSINDNDHKTPDKPLQVNRQTDLIITRSEQEEKEQTFISSTRIVKIWIYSSSLNKFIFNSILRRDLVPSIRNEQLNGDLTKEISLRLKDQVRYPCTYFMNLPDLYETERVLVGYLPQGIVFSILFNGRITSSYLQQFEATCILLHQNIPALLKMDDSGLKAFLEKILKISHSMPFTEPVENSNQQLLAVGISPETEKDILEDAGGFTPAEYKELFEKMKTYEKPHNQASILDEVDTVSHRK